MRKRLFSLKKRSLQGDLIEAFQYLKGTYKKPGDRLCTGAWNDRTRENGSKLTKSRFSLDNRKKIL